MRKFEAARWREALERQWGPLGRAPESPGEAAAIALHWELTEWAQGTRAELIELSVHGLDKRAFVTLACLRWPRDPDKDRLPKELQLAKEGRPHHQQTAMAMYADKTPDDALVAG